MRDFGITSGNCKGVENFICEHYTQTEEKRARVRRAYLQ